MNEIMKVLTIISTIFMPLSFIAGVYGMNFDTPTSTVEHAGAATGSTATCSRWRLMAVVAIGQLYFFRRKAGSASTASRSRQDDPRHHATDANSRP